MHVLCCCAFAQFGGVLGVTAQQVRGVVCGEAGGEALGEEKTVGRQAKKKNHLW